MITATPCEETPTEVTTSPLLIEKGPLNVLTNTSDMDRTVSLTNLFSYSRNFIVLAHLPIIYSLLIWFPINPENWEKKDIAVQIESPRTTYVISKGIFWFPKSLPVQFLY